MTCHNQCFRAGLVKDNAGGVKWKPHYEGFNKPWFYVYIVLYGCIVGGLYQYQFSDCGGEL